MWLLNVNVLKDAVAGDLGRDVPGPGYHHLPLWLDDGYFDAVLLQHVAMNIADRAGLYREIRRVLKTGSKFATFDAVSNGSEPHYPVPWARTPAVRSEA